MLNAIDFSSVYIPSITPSAAALLVSAGFNHAIIGYDSSIASAQVRSTLVNAGMSWSAYRFLYPGDPTPQIADVLKGIHQGPLPLPRYLFIDIEPYSGNVPTIAQIDQTLDLVEAADIKPTGTLVAPGIYTGKWVWDRYYNGFIDPAVRGWLLWAAQWDNIPDLNVTLFGNWQAAQVVGKQYAGNSNSAIGTVDVSVVNLVTAPTPSPTPTPDVSDAKARTATLVAALSSDLASAQAILADLTA